MVNTEGGEFPMVARYCEGLLEVTAADALRACDLLEDELEWERREETMAERVRRCL